MPYVVELLGYAGMAFTILAYAMKNTVRLRLAGIASSVAFLTYGWLSASYPVMMMEAILLPLNLYRLVEILWFGADGSTGSQSESFGSRLGIAGLSGSNALRDGVRVTNGRCDKLVVPRSGKHEWAGNTKSEIDLYGFRLADLEKIRRLDPNLASKLTQFLLSYPLIRIESDVLPQDAVRAA